MEAVYIEVDWYMSRTGRAGRRVYRAIRTFDRWPEQYEVERALIGKSVFKSLIKNVNEQRCTPVYCNCGQMGMTGTKKARMVGK